MNLNPTYRKKTFFYRYIGYIFIAIALLFVVNYYGLKAINGIRAFTTGESIYMKAQHEASRQLTNYIFTAKPDDFETFLKELKVPINDSLARIEMDGKNEHNKVRTHLIIAKNAPDDVNNIIWVYNNFKNYHRFKSAISIWKASDVLVGELQLLGKTIQSEISSKKLLTKSQQFYYTDKVNSLSNRMTVMGNVFDKKLVENIKFVNKAVLVINAIIAVIIATFIVTLSLKYITKLAEEQQRTQAQYERLVQTNTELDLFTHSVSHDLRAPISSLKGIITLAEFEGEEQQRQEYFDNMKRILARQDDFILKIIHFSKNKRTESTLEEIELKSFFDSILNDFKYISALPVDINCNIEQKTILIDAFRLEIICRNLISNAIKYADHDKKQCDVNITTDVTDNLLTITIADNGIGIESKHLSKIFDMFFVTSHHNKGSGIGLYLVKQMIQTLNGSIDLKSEFKVGSTFQVKLPIQIPNA